MTYPTHKQYSVSFAFVAAMLIYYLDISKVNYYLALIIFLTTSKYGALFPDLDHSWQNVKEKTVPNWIINKLIHLTKGKHRSWQTHSIDITVISTITLYMIPRILLANGKITAVNAEVMLIIFIGFCSGWISHIVADMMTSAGVRLFCWNKGLIIRLVPKQIGRLKFNTGHEWESFVYRAVRKINIVLGILAVIYPILLNGILKSMINSIILYQPNLLKLGGLT